MADLDHMTFDEAVDTLDEVVRGFENGSLYEEHDDATNLLGRAIRAVEVLRDVMT